jgi:hypothetical protein
VTGVVSGTTRELACLALGHDDPDEPACTATDEQLVRELVDLVQQLRVAAGLVEESDLDRQERVEVLADVLDDDRLDGTPGGMPLAQAILDLLDEGGWSFHPIRRP